jgi:UDPglucose--hexose-1-phosphate uridylyltransferase
MTNEFRQDIVSGDWVLIASVRALRPDALRAGKSRRVMSPRKGCPFEEWATMSNEPPVLAYPDDKKNWKMVVIPNKYPILARGKAGSRSELFRHGVYQGRTAVGTAWLLVTRDHDRHFDMLSSKEAIEVFEAFRDAHHAGARDKAMAYVASFYNYGPTAGGSIWHPHYQILTLPVIPTHTIHTFRGAQEYHRRHGTCPRCDIIAAERRNKKRVIAENDHAIAFAPYASQEPFEVSVLPKKHWPSFRDTSPETLRDVALLVRDVLKKVKVRLGDPDLNFYIHDIPLDRKDYDFHHWHVEILPRTKIEAGFEFSTGIGVNAVDPNDAAAILRGDAVVSRTHF